MEKITLYYPVEVDGEMLTDVSERSLKGRHVKLAQMKAENDDDAVSAHLLADMYGVDVETPGLLDAADFLRLEGRVSEILYSLPHKNRCSQNEDGDVLSLFFPVGDVSEVLLEWGGEGVDAQSMDDAIELVLQQYPDEVGSKTNDDGSVVLKLFHPIEIGEKQVDEILFRRPTGADLKAVRGTVGGEDFYDAVMARVSGVDVATLESLHCMDYLRVQEVRNDFLFPEAITSTEVGASL